jgi:RimK family alpha-L-glutamate ligase
LPYPKSAVVFNEKGAKEALKSFPFPLVVKTSAGRQGKGVFLCKSFQDVLAAIEEIHNQGVEAVVIREFIPNDGDLRIFTVGYKAIGAMKRSPTKKDEFRSNISLGGRGEKFELGNYPEIKSIAESAAEVMRTEIAGVDIIIHKETARPYILEVNPSPQFEGFEKYTGVNAAEKIIEYFEERRNQNK